MKVESAVLTELADCQAIYAHHVLHGTGTFEEIPPSLEELTRRFQEITGAGWAWLVAKDETGVLGFGYYSQFRARSAYRFTVEDSVYVREGVRGQGAGKAIVATLLRYAGEAGFTQMLALIGDSENTGSIGVHASLGFVPVGTMRRVGFKFGRWLDVVMMQKSLPDLLLRNEIIEGIQASAAVKITAGPSAAHSQDFLYGKDGLPE